MLVNCALRCVVGHPIAKVHTISDCSVKTISSTWHAKDTLNVYENTVRIQSDANMTGLTQCSSKCAARRGRSERIIESRVIIQSWRCARPGE